MKVFEKRGDATFAAEVSDDAVCMHIGAGEPPIVEIDYEHKTYRRHGLNALPFPERWYQTGTGALFGGMTVEWVQVDPVVPVIVSARDSDITVNGPPDVMHVRTPDEPPKDAR